MDDVKYDRENNNSLFVCGLLDAYFDRDFNPHWCDDGRKVFVDDQEDVNECTRGYWDYQ